MISAAHICTAGFALLGAWFLWRYAKVRTDAKSVKYAAISLLGVASCEIAAAIMIAIQI